MVLTSFMVCRIVLKGHIEQRERTGRSGSAAPPSDGPSHTPARSQGVPMGTATMRSVNYRLLMLPVIKGEGGGAPVAHGWSHLHQPRPITDGIDAGRGRPQGRGGRGIQGASPLHHVVLFFLGLISETRSEGGGYMYSNIRAINRRKWGHRRMIQEPDQR